jgi:lysophospholipase L1-like esterase
MMIFRYLIFSIVVLAVISCKTDRKEEISYLALGDSYTIGESVDTTLRWPVQLAEEFKKEGFKITPPQIIARTGWTTDELMAAMDTASLNPPYDLVSVLIGVNNQYRGRDTANYRIELEEILERAVQLAGNKEEKVFVVSIPDWGVMPFAKEKKRDPASIAREINNFNSIKKQVAESRGLTYIYITDISREASENPSLIAEDGLHPSVEMYGEWVGRMVPVVRGMLKKQD